MEKQHFWKSRLRIPILEQLLDICRLLPEFLQGIIMLSLYLILMPSFIFGLAFEYIETLLFPMIFGIQISLLLILVQKNYLYRKISKINNAIEIGILWIVTQKDQRRMKRHLIVGILMILFAVWYHYSNGFEEWLRMLIIYMIGFFYFLKGLFYVPALYIKYEKQTSLLIMSDESEKEHFKIEYSYLNKIEIRKDGIVFNATKESHKLVKKIDFIKKTKKINDLSNKETKRLHQFLKGIFPEKEILFIH